MSLETKSNIEDLKKKLREEAFIKASEMIEEAKHEAELIIKQAENEWRVKADNEKRRIIEQAERDANRIVSEARVKARLVIGEAKNKLFEELFSNVLERIRSREGLDVTNSLRNLLNESLVYIDKPSKIFVDPRDIEVIKRLLKEKNLNNVEIIPLNDIIGGLIIEDIDGKRIDNSYKTRLERAKKTLGSLITKYLWSS